MRDRPSRLTAEAERKIRAAGFASVIDAAMLDAERDLEVCTCIPRPGPVHMVGLGSE